MFFFLKNSARKHWTFVLLQGSGELIIKITQMGLCVRVSKIPPCSESLEGLTGLSIFVLMTKIYYSDTMRTPLDHKWKRHRQSLKEPICRPPKLPASHKGQSLLSPCSKNTVTHVFDVSAQERPLEISAQGLLGAGPVGILCPTCADHTVCIQSQHSHYQLGNSRDIPETHVLRCQPRANLANRTFCGW